MDFSNMPKFEAKVDKAILLHKELLKYYGKPTWRNPLPPLDELISTILSQNTNDTNRDRAFDSLKNRFPTWEAVRDAQVEDLIETIKVAGLANQKGPRIQEILKSITNQEDSLDLGFLKEYNTNQAYNWLLQFKGVGPKTASIVLLFSLEKPAFPVDTHIYRVSGRLGLRPVKMNAEKTHEHLANLFPPETYYPVHLNMIRLGREICQARNPKCKICPLQILCEYYQEKNNGN